MTRALTLFTAETPIFGHRDDTVDQFFGDVEKVLTCTCSAF
jgi:hypothetical protein